MDLATLAPLQPTLFGTGTPDHGAVESFERIELAAGAWVEFAPGWLAGEQSLFDELAHTAQWAQHSRPMYDRVVDVPRLTAGLPLADAPDVLRSAVGDLAERYGEPFDRIGLALYRNGADSVAPHGDQVARDLDTTVMATISLGARRRFVVHRPGEPTHTFDLGHGDLLVMGGTIQRTWTHAVPKTRRPVGPRICVMIRPPWLG